MKIGRTTQKMNSINLKIVGALPVYPIFLSIPSSFHFILPYLVLYEWWSDSFLFIHRLMVLPQSFSSACRYFYYIYLYASILSYYAKSCTSVSNIVVVNFAVFLYVISFIEHIKLWWLSTPKLQLVSTVFRAFLTKFFCNSIIRQLEMWYFMP